jgi:hypothetical protein
VSHSCTKAMLSEAAELNPCLPEKLKADCEVSFVPMSAVSAEFGSIEHEETRSYAQVTKGFTPFIAGDILLAKITPCFENGKIAQANTSRAVGFGSTEWRGTHSRLLLLTGPPGVVLCKLTARDEEKWAEWDTLWRKYDLGPVLPALPESPVE